jgi:hypothetical protein
LKTIFTAFLVFAILAQTFVHVGIAVYYEANKAFITEKLCENKADINKHCNGRCYLTKQLKKTEDNSAKHSTQLLKEREEYISNRTESFPIVWFPILLSVKFPSIDFTFHSSGFIPSLTKPPTV